MQLIINDGGRAAAGYKGNAGDCVCRAICIATGKPYQEVYDLLAKGNATQRSSKRESKSKARTGRKTAQNGIFTKRKWFNDLMISLGFEWIPTMQIGSGCTVHLRETELPKGRLVVSVSKHMAAVIDGVLHDTYDCSREGTRCVYGYYILKTGNGIVTPQVPFKPVNTQSIVEIAEAVRNIINTDIDKTCDKYLIVASKAHAETLSQLFKDAEGKYGSITGPFLQPIKGNPTSVWNVSKP